MITVSLYTSALILILFAFTICALFLDFDPLILMILNSVALFLCLINFISLIFIILEAML